MSTISTFHSFTSICNLNHFQIPRDHSHSFVVYFRENSFSTRNLPNLSVTQKSRLRRVKSAEEESQIPEPVAGVEQEASPEQPVAGGVEQEASSEQPVAVPVSPSDKLIMFFQAEGTMNESAIPTITQALEETTGISDLKVGISEGIASVELTKQTTIQATGVASGLVEAIQGAGFKLQTLNLSFEDEELLMA